MNPGAATDRPILVAEAGAYRFVAPDNRLLDKVFQQRILTRVHRLDPDGDAVRGFRPASARSPGRDLLAPRAAGLAGGTADPATLGPAVDGWAASPPPRPRHSENSISCPVVFADSCGDFITFTSADALDDLRGVRTRAGGRDLPFCRTCAAIAPGFPLALLNSCRLLEVAARDGGAAAELGKNVGDVVVIHVSGGRLGCYSG